MTAQQSIPTLCALVSLLLAVPAPVLTRPQAASGGGSDQHGYFRMLVARPEHVVSYSLRDPAQLGPSTTGGHAHSAKRDLRVSYDPAADRYARKQDAAKVLIAADGNSLRNQVRLPLRHGPEGFMLTWDAWWGQEFRFDNAAIRNYKAFQLESGGRIWTEIRSRFQGATRYPGAVALVDIRPYGPSAGRKGARVGNVNYGGGSLGGQLSSFAIAANTWTRYWVQITPRAGTEWWDLSMWMADEARGPVKLFDREAVKPNGAGWDRFWIEYNTSTNAVKAGRGELVGYVRNVVVLRPLKDASTILQRPLGNGPAPPPPGPESPSSGRTRKPKQSRP